MASITTYISIVIVTCIGAGHAEFVKLKCKTENIGQFGHQSLVECVIETTLEVSNPKIRVVLWTKEGDKDPLLRFYQREISQKEGYGFAAPSWNNMNMNVSLLITNTAVAHEGGYTCMVITDSGSSEGLTKLKVTAKYNTPTISSISKRNHQVADDALICNAEGGYPKGQLRWFVEQTTDWTQGSHMEAKQETSGLFLLSSKLILKSGSTFSKYTCIVFNASGGKEDEITFEMPQDPVGRSGGLASENPSKIVAPVVVIGSLIIGLLLLLFIKRRSQKVRRHSAVPLMDGHEAVHIHDVEEGPHDDYKK